MVRTNDSPPVEPPEPRQPDSTSKDAGTVEGSDGQQKTQEPQIVRGDIEPDIKR